MYLIQKQMHTGRDKIRGGTKKYSHVCNIMHACNSSKKIDPPKNWLIYLLISSHKMLINPSFVALIHSNRQKHITPAINQKISDKNVRASKENWKYQNRHS